MDTLTTEEKWLQIQKDLGIEDKVDEQVDTPTTDTSNVEIPSTENLTPDTETPQTQTIKIKFDGQDLDLTQDEAIKLAQLGKFYENKVKPDYDSLKSHSAIKMVNELAKEFGMTPEDFVKATYQEAEMARIERTKKQYNTEDETLAKKIVEQDTKLQQLEDFKKQQEIDTMVNQQISNFSTKYPEVNLNSLPDEVTANVSKGMDLITAYELHTVNNKDSEIQRLQAEIDKLKANTSNTESAPPNIGSTKNGTIADVTSPDFAKNVNSKEDLDNWVASLSNLYKKNKK